MRYRGPKAKVMRRFGLLLASSPKYARILEKRPNPPGQHGARARRGKIGAYGSRLNEKQKLRALYGIAERQMRRYVAEATRRQGPTGTNLLQIPSYEVRPGQTITLTERMKRSRQMAVWAERGGILPPAYLELDRDTMTGRLVKVPDRDEIPIPVDDRLIVEFYSR